MFLLVPSMKGYITTKPKSGSEAKKKENAVEPLYNGHLGDRREWPLQRGGHSREVETRVNVWTVRQKKMSVVERWPLMEVRL